MKVLSKSSLMAVALAAAVVIWMLTGLGRANAPSAANGQASRAESSGASGMPAGFEPAPGDSALPVSVTVTRTTAAPIVRDVVASGRTEPNRAVEIKAETEGRIVDLGAERGQRIARGDRIARIDLRDREAQRAQAAALVDHRRAQHDAAQKLEGQQLVAQVQIAETRAQLAAAEAELERIERDIARTAVVAPFDGVLQERDVELGDYVGIADPVARIVDIDPLIAVAEVSEREVGTIVAGAPGRVELIDGRVVQGTVRYVSNVADESTRTFRVELAIPNVDGELPAGMTAQLRLPANETVAHFLSPAMLVLDDAGTIGVKTVNARDVVEFHEVELVNSSNEGVWVTGLPDTALVISVGQGFVAPGTTVRPVEASQR